MYKIIVPHTRITDLAEIFAILRKSGCHFNCTRMFEGWVIILT